MRRMQIPVAVLLAVVVTGGPVAAVDEVYAPPRADEVRSSILQWVAENGMKDEALLQQLGTVWGTAEGLSSGKLLDKTVETFALVDPATKEFVAACSLIETGVLPPEPKPLAGLEEENFYSSNLRLFYARYLTQRKMYDEALEQFAKIKPDEVVDPASCLYYRAVCEHQLLLKEEGLQTLEALLSNTQDVPVRYSTVATLMQHELKGLKEKSLDEAAHMMKDVERRLGLGRGGQRVQRQEAKILITLDEIIEKLEQQGGT